MTFPKRLYLANYNALQDISLLQAEVVQQQINHSSDFIYALIKYIVKLWGNHSHEQVEYSNLISRWKEKLWKQVQLFPPSTVDSVVTSSVSSLFLYSLLVYIEKEKHTRVCDTKQDETRVSLNCATNNYSVTQGVDPLSSYTSSSAEVLKSQGNQQYRPVNKQTRKVLNDWFEANIHFPYPSENVKKDLALKAGISISQVNTFFGNKRMRTKRRLFKAIRSTNRNADRSLQTDVTDSFSPRFRWKKQILPKLVELHSLQEERDDPFKVSSGQH
eukprot:jgi/Galph1/783/GphlegSOOS_G5515.1